MAHTRNFYFDVVFCILVLMTRPLWDRPIRGTWWSRDPTLTLTLVLWFMYMAALMLRIETYDPKWARFAAILGIIGFVDVPSAIPAHSHGSSSLDVNGTIYARFGCPRWAN